MSDPQLNFLTCPHAGSQSGFHRMAYWNWGRDRHPHVVVCVHGISRQGLDFDVLARCLVGSGGARCRVVSVDVAGRGMSDWLADPMCYHIPQYASDLLLLISHLRSQGAQTVDWVGTSMGGLIGITVAAQTASLQEWKHCSLRKLILNDVGPTVQWAALQRISAYLGADKRFSSEQELVNYLRVLSSSFGHHSADQWWALCKPMIRADRHQFKLHYDPAIAVPVRATTPDLVGSGEALLWRAYDVIQADTLLLRGAESDLLSAETAQQMQRCGPRARLVEFAEVGHAPTLVQPEQVKAVQDFLFAK